MDPQGQKVAEDENPQSVTLEDVKKATPAEEEAETAILKTLEESGTTADQSNAVKSLNAAATSTTNEKEEEKMTEGQHRIYNAAMKVRLMHRVANAVQSKGETTPELTPLEEAGKGFRSSVTGNMNTTTNAMVANANILLKRRSANEATKGDVESAEQGDQGSLDHKKSDGVSSNSPPHKHHAYDGVKDEMKNIYHSLRPEGSKIVKQIRLALFFSTIFFIVAVITYYSIEPGAACIAVPAYAPPTIPTFSSVPSKTPTLSPSGTPSQTTRAPTDAPSAVARRRLQEEIYSEEVQGCTTISWVFLFLIRQIVTYFLALLVQLLVIDVLCLHYHWLTRLLGPLIVLCIVQSKGWPFILIAWSLLDFGLLYGSDNFAKHWLHWQNVWLIFTKKNPAGNVTSCEEYLSILITMLTLGVFTAIKRVAFGLMFGKQSYKNFHEQLTEVMEQILLIGSVANLAKQIEMKLVKHPIQDGVRSSINWGANYASFASSRELSVDFQDESESVVMIEREDLTATQRAKIIKLVGDWEEPQISTYDSPEAASLDDIIHFSQTLAFINNRYPFSISFGKARTREDCVQSAIEVFKRLQMHTNSPDDIPFETISIAARDKRGNLNEHVAKNLIRAFRPDRQGNLSLIDFVKSCDNAYKKLRLLQASIKNSSQIDNAAERIYNVIYFFLYIVLIQTAFLGLDGASNFVLGLFALITPLSFALSSACGKYVEGVMLVLNRKPYGIGDRIAVSQVDVDTSKTGSSTWFVENVDLFTTTVRFSITNEVATLANSALAPCRIINANRSPNAVIRVNLKFAVDIPKSILDKFYESVEEFVKEKPREFLQLNALCASSIVVEQGYVEYLLTAQHQESWQNMGSVWPSKVALTQFCHEESRRLGIRFTRPILPVTVKLSDSSGQRLSLAEIRSTDEGDSNGTGD